MSQTTKQKLHRDVRTIDLPDIARKYGTDRVAFRECVDMIDAALNRIKLFPDREGRPCEFEPLVGFRKVKVFSTRNQPKGTTPDLRIIYRYNERDDAVEILAIGFRVKQRPRPPEDPYSRASNRDFLFSSVAQGASDNS